MWIMLLVVFYGIKGKIQLCTVIAHSHSIRANYFLHTFNWKRFAKIIGMKRPGKMCNTSQQYLCNGEGSTESLPCHTASGDNCTFPNTVVNYTCTITSGTPAGLTDWALPTGTCPTNAFPDKIRLSQFVSGQCAAQLTSICGPYRAYSILSSDPTYCLSSILTVNITAAMNGSTVMCNNTNYLNSSITGVVFSATINIVAVTTPPDSLNTGAIVGGVVGVLIVTIIIVAIVIVIRCRKCGGGGGEVNRIASRSRHDGSNTAELLNTSATSQSGDVAQERDPKPDKSTVGRSHKSTGIAFSRKDGNHVTEIHEETTATVKPYLAEKDADCSKMKMVGTDARDGLPGGASTPGDMVGTDGPSTDICVTVAGVQEHADQDKLKEGPKSQCVFSTGSPAPVNPRGEETGYCEKLSYKDVLLYQPQPHLLYKAGDCTTRACVVSEPKKIEQADGEFYPPLKNVPSDHMYIDLENKY